MIQPPRRVLRQAGSTCLGFCKEFADRTFAKYQLDLDNALRKYEAGRLSKPKFETIEKKCIKVLVLMQSTGQPATLKYMKERVYTDASGSQCLKAGGERGLSFMPAMCVGTQLLIFTSNRRYFEVQPNHKDQRHMFWVTRRL